MYFTLNVKPEILAENGLYSPWLKWKITLVSTEYCCLRCGKAVTVTARGSFRSSLARANVPFFYISISFEHPLADVTGFLHFYCEWRRPWRPSVAPAALLPLFRRAAVLRSFQQNDGVQYGRDELPLIMVQGPVSVFLAVVLAATAHGRLDGKHDL